MTRALVKKIITLVFPAAMLLLPATPGSALTAAQRYLMVRQVAPGGPTGHGTVSFTYAGFTATGDAVGRVAGSNGAFTFTPPYAITSLYAAAGGGGGSSSYENYNGTSPASTIVANGVTIAQGNGGSWSTTGDGSGGTGIHAGTGTNYTGAGGNGGAGWGGGGAGPGGNASGQSGGAGGGGSGASGTKIVNPGQAGSNGGAGGGGYDYWGMGYGGGGGGVGVATGYNLGSNVVNISIGALVTSACSYGSAYLSW